jgi:hypothetical protein
VAQTLIQWDAGSLDGDTVPVTAGDLPATYDSINGRLFLVFPDGTDETAAVGRALEMPQSYAASTLTAKIGYITGATANEVIWEVYVEAVTPADAVDLDSATSFDSVNTTTDTVPATAGHLKVASVTLTNKDSVAAGDMVRILLRRDSDHANDDAAASAYVLWVAIQEAS